MKFTKSSSACSKKYLSPFEFQIKQFCLKHSLLKKDDKILISLSGGVDSVSLLRLLGKFQKIFNLRLRAVHFNHGVREESSADEELVRSLCEESEIPLDVVELEFDSKKDFQNQGRIKRLDKTIKIFEAHGMDSIAQAHHLDDLVETQIWRIIRGTSVFGLNPLTPKSGHIIRPLSEVSKKLIYDYARLEKLHWNEDLSNQSTDYTRNFIRLKIVPMMEKIGGEAFKEKMLGLARDSEKLTKLADSFSEDSTKGDCLSYSKINSLPEIYAQEFINRFLIAGGIRNIRRETIVKIYQFAQSNTGGWQLKPEKNFIIEGGKGQIRIVNSLSLS